MMRLYILRNRSIYQYIAGATHVNEKVPQCRMVTRKRSMLFIIIILIIKTRQVL